MIIQLVPLKHSSQALFKLQTDQPSGAERSNFAKRGHELQMKFLIVFNVPNHNTPILVTYYISVNYLDFSPLQTC